MKANLFKTIFFILIFIASFAPGNNLGKASIFGQADTLHIMISEANNIYYYDNTLKEDASNFMSTNPKGIRNVIYSFANEAKGKGHQLIILLKIQKQSALNESSKKVVDYIRQQNYRQVNLLPVEEELIKITEGNN